MRRFLLLFLWVFLVGPVIAGGWVQPYHGGYVQLSTSYIQYQSLHNRFDDPIQLPRTVQDWTVQLYAEYGIDSGLTILTNFPVKLLKTGRQRHPDADFSEQLPPGQLQGIGNIRIGGRYQLYRSGKWSITGQATMALPTFSRKISAGLQAGYPAWGLIPELQAGYSQGRFYSSVQGGVELWDKGYSTHLFAQLEAGYEFVQSWQIIGAISTRKSLYDGSDARSPFRQTGLFVNNREYLVLTLKIHKQFTEHWGVMGMASGGRPSYNVPQGIVWMANVNYQWGGN